MFTRRIKEALTALYLGKRQPSRDDRDVLERLGYVDDKGRAKCEVTTEGARRARELLAQVEANRTE